MTRAANGNFVRNSTGLTRIIPEDQKHPVQIIPVAGSHARRIQVQAKVNTVVALREQARINNFLTLHHSVFPS